MPRISLCSTNYNTYPITRRSLESVLASIDGLDCEVVVVDNFSDDGSYEALMSHPKSVPILLERRRCSRGMGRQRAYQMSRGDYIVTFDLDTIYNDRWARLLRWVIANEIPFGLSAVFSQFYPRPALRQVGGWRDFQYWEDVDLWVRLAARGLYRTYPVVCGDNLKRLIAGNALSKWARLYARYRDKIAIADWIPFRLYWEAYLALLRNPRNLYYLSIFFPGYLAGRYKRSRLCTDPYDPSVLLSPSLPIDCGLVRNEELILATSPYDTTLGCREALARGDFGFLPGTYD